MSESVERTPRQARCGACLSRGRRLAALGAARASHLLFSLGEDVGSELQVCWECRALVDKTLLFGERMRRANDAMIKSNLFTVSPDQDIDSVSTLRCITKTGYDLALYCDIDDIVDEVDGPFGDEDSIQDTQKILSIVTPYLNLYVKEDKATDPFENISETAREANAKELIDDKTIDITVIKDEPTHSCHENELMVSKESTHCRIHQRDEETDMIKTESGLAEVQEHSKLSIETCNDIIFKVEPVQINKEEEPICGEDFRDEHIQINNEVDEQIFEEDPVIVEVIKNANKSRPIFIQSKHVTERVNEPINAKIGFPLLTSLLQNQHKSIEKLHIETINNANIKTLPKLHIETINSANIKTLPKLHIETINRENIKSIPRNLCKDIDTKQPVPPDVSCREIATVNGDLPLKTSQLPEDKVRQVYMDETEMLEARASDRLNKKYLQYEYKCDTCIVSFYYKALLDEHNQIRHSPEVGSHLCDICGVRFKNDGSLSKHHATHYYKYVCEVCGFARRQKAETCRHYKAEHEPSLTYQCEHCGKEFLSPGKLKYHINMTHIPSKQCALCPTTFKSELALRRHEKAHETVRTYECDVCGVLMPSKGRLETHVRDFHKGLPVKAYCAVCNKQFPTTVEYRTHAKTHAKRAKYTCDYCNKRFVTKSYMQRHILCDHLKCKLCDKVYFGRYTCKTKVKGVKDKLCNVCGKGFSYSANLSMHMLVHTGERPHQCDICGATFSQGSSLAGLPLP